MKYKPSEEIAERIEKAFTYHKPIEGKPERYRGIRDAAKFLAMIIAEYTPESREQRTALDKLDEVTMFANAAISRNEGEKQLITVLINGMSKSLPGPSVSYETITALAGGRAGVRVKYSDTPGGFSGFLIEGVSVRICEGTRFTVVSIP